MEKLVKHERPPAIRQVQFNEVDYSVRNKDCGECANRIALERTERNESQAGDDCHVPQEYAPLLFIPHHRVGLQREISDKVRQ
jgi:hypothetical protein